MIRWLELFSVATILALAGWAVPICAPEPVDVEGPEALSELLETLGPVVDRMESAATRTTWEELKPLLASASELVSLIEARKSATEESASESEAELIRQARRMADRIAALELEADVNDFNDFVQQALKKETLSPDEIDQLGTRALALVNRIIDLQRRFHPAAAEQDAETGAGSTGTMSAEAVDVLAEMGEELEWSDLPESLLRARELLHGAVALEVTHKMRRIAAQIESLEARARTLTDEDLDPVRKDGEHLCALMEAYFQTADRRREEKLPPALTPAADLCRRWTVLDLQGSVNRWGPLVDELTERKAPLNKEEAGLVREIPDLVRPKLRAAQRAAERGDKVPEVDDARELIQKSSELLPETRAMAEEPRDFPENQPIDRPFRFYGSMRLRLFLRDGGAAALNTETSRVGFNANGRISKAVSVYGRIELSTTLGDKNSLSDSGSDPGGESITDKVTIGHRLLFIGLKTPKGNVSIGKQWSAYYDIGVYTDQLPYLGARGTGVFNAGTDGGVSGTGRASNSLQYRGATQPFKYTVQIQARNETSNDRVLMDSFGFSLSMSHSDFDFGVAFQKVLDGAVDPQEGEPKDGDQATIIGVRYDKDAWYGALTLTSFRNHETDDLGAFYNGVGASLYADRDLGQRWNVSLDIAYLRPDGRYAGEFLVRQVILGMNCDVTNWFRLWVLSKLDTGRQSNGTRTPVGTLIIAGHFNF